MREEIIRISHVEKNYGPIKVLNDVSMTMKANKAICLLGHNGSGKSTFLKIVAKLMNPSSGSVSYHENLKISYVPDRFPKLNMTIHEFLWHMGMIQGVDKKALASNIEKLYQKFFISDMKNVKLKNLSKGSLQKVAIIQALLDSPDVLLMDEPLSGLDEESKQTFIQLIKELKRNGTAVLICCHEKILIDHIADECYEIVNGKLMKRNNFPTKYANMLFSSTLGTDVLEEVQHLIREVYQENAFTRIIVEHNYADEVLLFLLKKKWSLKEMSMEENHHELHI